MRNLIGVLNSSATLVYSILQKLISQPLRDWISGSAYLSGELDSDEFEDADV